MELFDPKPELDRLHGQSYFKKIAGEDPGFEDFMDKFGDMFGDTPPKTLDELLEQMRRQMAASQS